MHKETFYATHAKQIVHSLLSTMAAAPVNNSLTRINTFLIIFGLSAFRISSPITSWQLRIFSISSFIAYTGLTLTVIWHLHTVQVDVDTTGRNVLMMAQSTRDCVLLLGYPGLIACALHAAHKRKRFFVQIAALDRRLERCSQNIQLELHSADSRACRQFWLECSLSWLFYNLIVLPIERDIYDLHALDKTLFFWGFILAAVGFLWQQSLTKLSATMLQQRARCVCTLLRVRLHMNFTDHATTTNAQSPAAAFVLVADVCRLRQQFERAFAGSLLFVYGLLLFTSLFNVYFTLQIFVRHHMAIGVLVDFAVYQLPQMLWCSWMVTSSMHRFGEMVSLTSGDN